MIIQTIYKAPYEVIIDEEEGAVVVTIKYGNESSTGTAYIHPDDTDYFSPRIGKNIALSKARIKALEWALVEAKLIFEIKDRTLRELVNYDSRELDTVDPTGKLRKNVNKARDNVNRLRKAIKTEKASLNCYLAGQKEAIAIFKKNREKDKNNQSI